MNTHSFSRRAHLATTLITLAAALSGCVGYNVYPPEAGERGFSNPNNDPFPPVMTAALQWATVRYPPNTHTEFSVAAPAGPEQDFALNLPAGVTPLLAQRIATLVGNGAKPLHPGNEALPVYHIARVWISGDEAKVDVVRPIRGLPMSAAANFKDASQGITVRLRGGMQPWHVTSHRVWSINSMTVPALNFVTGYPEGRNALDADAASDPATDPSDSMPTDSTPSDSMPSQSESLMTEPASEATTPETNQ